MSNTPVMQQLRLPPQHGRYYQAVDNIHAKGLELVVCTNTRPACLAVLYCHAVNQPPRDKNERKDGDQCRAEQDNALPFIYTGEEGQQRCIQITV